MERNSFIDQAERAEILSKQIEAFRKNKESLSVVSRYKVYSDLNSSILNIPNDMLRDVLLNQLRECGV